MPRYWNRVDEQPVRRHDLPGGPVSLCVPVLTYVWKCCGATPQHPHVPRVIKSSDLRLLGKWSSQRTELYRFFNRFPGAHPCLTLYALNKGFLGSLVFLILLRAVRKETFDVPTDTTRALFATYCYWVLRLQSSGISRLVARSIQQLYTDSETPAEELVALWANETMEIARNFLPSSLRLGVQNPQIVELGNLVAADISRALSPPGASPSRLDDFSPLPLYQSVVLAVNSRLWENVVVWLDRNSLQQRGDASWSLTDFAVKGIFQSFIGLWWPRFSRTGSLAPIGDTARAYGCWGGWVLAEVFDWTVGMAIRRTCGAATITAYHVALSFVFTLLRATYRVDRADFSYILRELGMDALRSSGLPSLARLLLSCVDRFRQMPLEVATNPDELCVMCLEPLGGERVAHLPCGHWFHESQLPDGCRMGSRWVRHRGQCPYCRAPAHPNAALWLRWLRKIANMDNLQRPAWYGMVTVLQYVLFVPCPMQGHVQVRD
eukprot:TRINITY_DN18873_c0_g1_i1.p1 TRINITY_DN18873_c0_g1~~TRINITY_DN18873_c0_g1_i1.p1  ORF type:complete len:510 (+),score=46.97 TRINITY_DN18873_c0_g1_i1:58-1530(+)